MSQASRQVEGGLPLAVSSLDDGTSARRSPDERLFLRIPTAARLIGDLLMRLPARSRVRRLFLVRSVRRGYAALNRRDFAVLLMGLDKGIEYRPQQDLVGPDQDAVLDGHEAYVQFGRDWFSSFEDLRQRSRRTRSTSETKFSSRSGGRGTDRAAEWCLTSRCFRSCVSEGDAWASRRTSGTDPRPSSRGQTD